MDEDSHAASQSARVGYVLSRYPAISRRAALNEVQGLRARGLHVETLSLDAPDRPLSRLEADEASEAHNTEYLSAANRAQRVAAIARIAAWHPAPLPRALATIARTPLLALDERKEWTRHIPEAMRIGSWMHGRQLEHMHIDCGGTLTAAALLTASAWRIPYSLGLRHPDDLRGLSADMAGAALSGAEFVVCDSDFCRSQVLPWIAPEGWGRVHVIRLGVDPAALAPSLTARRENARRLEIVSVGRLTRVGGQRTLLEALVPLQERGVDFSLSVLGDGPERSSLDKMARQCGMANRVVFASALSREETLARVREADLFVSVPFADSSPLSLMEAMSMGIPCIGTSIESASEFIQTGRDGLLVAPANVDELTDALGLLAGDPTLRQFLGRSARRRIVCDFNLPLHHERLMTCFTARHRAL
jgi:colanic acid/amylovoran biosynthesis glycosyltransferase